MGQRANLVLGNAGGYELYYSHWCANTLPRDLFWGAEHAMDFVLKQRAITADEGWLDTIWAEGGAVIDVTNKTFLFFGGEDLLYDVPLRRLFLKMIRAAWGDWTIRWAYEGIVDVAEYVGVARESVIANSNHKKELTKSLSPPQERDWLRCIGSIRSGDELDIYPLGSCSTIYSPVRNLSLPRNPLSHSKRLMFPSGRKISRRAVFTST